ncbi:hypothetical protein DV735_g5339, partial [Chaetothyriales sp. CBS 134920]
MARTYRTTPASSRTPQSRIVKCTQRKAQYKVERPQKQATSVSANINNIPSPESNVPNKKRKRSDSPVEPIPKAKESQLLEETDIKTSSASSQDSPEVDWAEYYGAWPPESPEMSGRAGRGSPIKRPHSMSRTPSYSQSVRDGDMPPAWTRQHELKMHKMGLIMAEYQTETTVTAECRTLCQSLVKAEDKSPSGPSFAKNRLLKMLDLVRFKNEPRIVRDITPLVVPSPELLNLDGHSGMEHICEAMNAEWSQCSTLCGPQPKPDLVAGIAHSAFASEEQEELRMNHTSDSPNLFPEDMYYPFLVCEVKGSDRPIQEAERQAMHSASIAVRAIVQLYKKISATEEVDGKILVISVAHNSTQIKIFGHFASIEEKGTRFFRHRIYDANFAADFESDQWYKSYNVTRAVYDKFFPEHLKRIKSALTRLRPRAVESFTSEPTLNDTPQASAVNPSSLQENEQVKRPALSATKRAQQEIETLRKQLEEMRCAQELREAQKRDDQHEQAALMERQLARQKEMMEQQMEQQMKLQKETMELQMKLQKETMEKQMEQQMKLQKETMEKQMEQQMKLQKETMEQQLAQHERIIELLMQPKI